MKINSICVVGGGSSGWMTASCLKKNFPEIDISLIESDKPPIGVGESTLESFNEFLQYMDLDDNDWMKECKATYKTSIRFKNFRENKEESFHYPFGLIKKNEENIDKFFHLQTLYPEKYPSEEGAYYFNPVSLFAENNKFIDSKIENLNYDPQFNASYHLDASLFGEFLKKKFAIPLGVKHYIGEVKYATKSPKGNIVAIHTNNKKSIEADLFVDCTGFKSLLLEDIMGVEYVSFNDVLFNDTALAIKIPYLDKEKQMHPYTDCVAMDHGWVWNIPLWDRIGMGYVFSQKYISIDKAKDEFKNYLNKTYPLEVIEKLDFNLIKIKHGKHKKAWVKNVVGIGLSYGFVEPLESTGLLTTHENIIKLVKALYQRDRLITQHDIDIFNWNIDSKIENFKIFVSKHYSMTSRQDNQYWKDCCQIEYDTNIKNNFSTRYSQESLEILYKNVYNSGLFNPNIEKGLGSFFLAIGHGLNPIDKQQLKILFKYHPIIKENLNNADKIWEDEKENYFNIINNTPSHYQYLKEKIYYV